MDFELQGSPGESLTRQNVKIGNLKIIYWLFRLFHAHPMYWVSRL